MQTIPKQTRAGTLAYAGGTVLLIFLILATGCTGQAPAGGLNGTEWTLVSYSQGGKVVGALTGAPVSLSFNDGGKLSGSSGCNRYFASFSATGSSLSIGQAGSTMMYCAEPGVMEQESVYLALLPQAKSYAVEGNRLVMSDASGTPILSFTKMVPPVPLPLTGTNWTLTGIHTRDAVSSVIAGSSVTATFEPAGNLAGSAGCNRYFGGYTANGTSMTIGSLGSTKMMCPEPGIMNQESAYLAALETVAGYQINGKTLILADKNGTPLLTFTGQL